MTMRRRTVVLVTLGTTLGVYLSGPIVAGIFEIGNRAGPKIYPMGLHEALYRIGWACSEHNGIKPRLIHVFDESKRPWFYGVYSENDDPEWMKREIERRRLRTTSTQASH